MGWFTEKKKRFKRRLNVLNVIYSKTVELRDWYIKNGAHSYITTRPIFWGIGGKHSHFRHCIPKGFEFESSVPKYLQWILSPDHPYFLFPAAVHDSLIERGYTRPLCDGEWLSAARYVKAPKYLREFAYLAIRLKQLVRGLNETA